ncbi:hypothetical protein AVEN_78632-1 [Araneus ventricosus]|uniref:Gustatory receptor n=1 Tax=Araneus ventricosus TaxID=182803 RepID=A0A4Y2K9L0_ARAVE|nr:hypothetical protein AVEN_78632-1 [Araneus ventricosus]
MRSFRNTSSELCSNFSICFNPNIAFISYIALSIIYILFFSMPVNIFMVFFISVCHDLKQLFDEYKTCMISQTHPDYHWLIKRYNFLRNVVIEIDSQINCLVFWAALANMFCLYFTITGIMGSEDISIWELIVLYSALIFGAFMFVLMCLWADRLSSSAASVAHAAQALDGNLDSPVMHIRYILTVNKKVRMTVWSLFPLTKSSVLASIGTVITYSVLIKGILNE